MDQEEGDDLPEGTVDLNAENIYSAWPLDGACSCVPLGLTGGFGPADGDLRSAASNGTPALYSLLKIQTACTHEDTSRLHTGCLNQNANQAYAGEGNEDL